MHHVAFGPSYDPDVGGWAGMAIGKCDGPGFARKPAAKASSLPVLEVLNHREHFGASSFKKGEE